MTVDVRSLHVRVIRLHYTWWRLSTMPSIGFRQTSDSVFSVCLKHKRVKVRRIRRECFVIRQTVSWNLKLTTLLLLQEFHRLHNSQKDKKESKVYRVALIRHVSSIMSFRLCGSNQVTRFEMLLCSVDEE